MLPTATALATLYSAAQASPVEAVRQALDLIRAHEDRVNAWVHVDDGPALAAARASEARWCRGEQWGPLDGVPVGVKDLLAVAGQPMRRGSPAYPPGFVPTEDAPVVARFREAGAILLGKTATPDSGCKLVTESLVHGITRNPWNPRLTPGGSSGGSAVALAVGQVPIALGTDGAGSIRVPAAYCGVFGMKPGTGRIPALPSPFWPHAVVGPMTRTVADTALAWAAATQPDPRDPYAVNSAGVDWPATAGLGLDGMTVAVAPGSPPEVMRAAQMLSSSGAKVATAAPNWPCDPLEPFLVFWRCMYAQALRLMPAAQAEAVDPTIRGIVAQAGNIDRAEFQDAIHARDLMAQAATGFHARYDLLLCRVMPCPPWEAGRATPAPYQEDDWSWCPDAYPFNMTRQPAASVPFGWQGGLPLAVQVVAGPGRDDLVLRAAAVLETAVSAADQASMRAIAACAVKAV